MPSTQTKSAPGPNPSAPQSTALQPDGRRVAVHTLDVKGRFINARRLGFAILIAVYLLMSLVRIGGHPAVQLNVQHRRFFLFGGTFNAQDFWIVLFIITALVFTLLLVTAWRGRLWCGWACPQTVFLEGLYRPIERLIDGPRNQRIKLTGAGWTAGRVARALLKHALYVAVSLLVAHAALSLFVSASALASMIREGPADHAVAFGWATAVTLALYINFAWFREQLCVVLCPYGRLQSVLHDDDSIVIAYDGRRGEPRGMLRKLPLVAEPREPRGDCIDCKKCVWACPTGIDIRNGLQMECLACAQCADVCDEVMIKIGRAPGLIRYTSLNAVDGKRARVLRPRLAVYAAAAAVAALALVLSLAGRRPFELIVVRQGAVPWVVDGSRVRNQLAVHLTNKSGQAARFRLRVDSVVAADARLGDTILDIGPLADALVPLVITFDRHSLRPGLGFELVVEDETAHVTQRSFVRFIAPGS